MTQIRIALIFTGLIAASAQAEEPPPANLSELTLDRIFAGKDFDEEKPRPIIWSKLAPGYFTLDASKIAAESDLVRHAPADKSFKVIVPSAGFIPPGQTKPLRVESFQFNADESKLLLFTNSQRVWRHKTRGDYWLLDLGIRKPTKLGVDAALLRR